MQPKREIADSNSPERHSRQAKPFILVKGVYRSVTDNFKSTFSHLLDADKLNQLARDAKFMVRKSKLTPAMFLDLMFYGIDTEIKSLRLTSAKAKECHSIQLSKQGLDDRFSQANIDFAKSLLDEAMASQVTTSLAADELHLFKRGRLKDSTAFGVHDSLSAYFEGYGKGGGKSSKAAIGIQYKFDIKSHRVLDIDLHSAVKKDSKDAVEKKDDIQKEDLIIRDLGYYSNQVIDEVQKKEAFFLSHLYSNSIVWVDEHSDKRLDFQALYRSMQQTQCTSMEMNAYIEKKRRLLRLIVELIPETVYEKRMNKQ